MKNKKIVYIDYFCFESLFVLIKNKYENCEVRYFQKSSILPHSFVAYLSRKNNLDISLIETIVASECFFGKMNFKEKRETDLTKVINKGVDQLFDGKDLISLLDSINYNKTKVRAYMENKIYWSLYRGMEILTIAKKNSLKEATIILNKNTFSYLLEQSEGEKILWYKNKISRFFGLSSRNDHFLDSFHKLEFKKNESYSLMPFIELFYYFIKTLISVVGKNKKIKFNQNNNIGISQYQLSLREDQANDIMWFYSGLVKNDSVFYLNTSVLDSKTKILLNKYGIASVRVNPRIRELLKFILKKDTHYYVVPTFSFYRKTIISIYKVWKLSLFNKNLWMLNPIIYRYIRREMYWRDLYGQLGLKFVWSMADGCQDSLIRSQAIEQNQGFYVGSNYSFFQHDAIPSQKLYDIYFTWGKYFSKTLMKRNKSKDSIFLDVGYVADSHFELSKNSAKKIRERFDGNYIVSYFDNNTGNDFELSKSMAFEMMSMFIDLLGKYQHMVLLLKPKRQDEINLYLDEFIEFKNYLDSGRIMIFLSSIPGERFAPATLGMASDLVVGLGINTAAIECFFAGANVIYANLAKFTSSKFYMSGVDKFIYNSIEDVTFNIENKVKNRERYIPSSFEKEAYSDLDNFQDGKAYKRIGWALSEVQKNVNKKSNRIKINDLEDELIKGIHSI